MRIHPLSCGLGFAFLIEDSYGLYLIDSGSPGRQGTVLAKMSELGRTDLRLIWITHAHYDHYGSAASLRALTGAQIGVHPRDADALASGQSPLGSARKYGYVFSLVLPMLNRLRSLPATPPDFVLEDGESLERFGLQAAVIHTPGHTPGHTCLLLPGGIAFAGDLLGRRPRPGPQSLVATDWSQLQNSLARFKAFEPHWIYTGHAARPLSGAVLQKINF